MDTIISRMMRLLGVIVVLGYVASGLRTAQLQDWDGTIAFLVFGAIAAGVFTLIWTIATYNILDEIGKDRKRSDITNRSIVGVSIGSLALFICAGFITAGQAATNGTNNTYSLWFNFLAFASTAILSIGWCCAELAFIKNEK